MPHILPIYSHMYHRANLMALMPLCPYGIHHGCIAYAHRLAIYHSTHTTTGNLLNVIHLTIIVFVGIRITQ